jgi:hypothetical protein
MAHISLFKNETMFVLDAGGQTLLGHLNLRPFKAR